MTEPTVDQVARKRADDAHDLAMRAALLTESHIKECEAERRRAEQARVDQAAENREIRGLISGSGDKVSAALGRVHTRLDELRESSSAEDARIRTRTSTLVVAALVAVNGLLLGVVSYLIVYGRPWAAVISGGH